MNIRHRWRRAGSYREDDDAALVEAFLAPLDDLEPARLHARAPEQAAERRVPPTRRFGRRRLLVAVALGLMATGTTYAVVTLTRSGRTVVAPTGTSTVSVEHGARWAECQGLQGRSAERARAVLVAAGYAISWRATSADDVTRVVARPPRGSVVYSILQDDPARPAVIVDTRLASDPESRRPARPTGC